MDDLWEARNRVRRETLLELAMVAEAVGPLSHLALREMGGEVVLAKATLIADAPQEDDDAYEVTDPKHRDFHSVHADLWDQRDGK